MVALTVATAIFLAIQELPEEELTPTVQPSPTVAVFVATVTSTPFPTIVLLPTSTPTATPSPVLTPLEEATVTPTATETALPPPPTSTPTTVLMTPTLPAIPTPTPAAPPPTATPAAVGVCQPPPTWVTYAVQTGDTLNSLANRTGTSVYELQQVNCLDSFTLRIGQTIYLPFTPPTPTVTHTPTATRPPASTPTRTPTPISPEVSRVVPSRVDEQTANSGPILITVLGGNFRPRESGFRAEFRGPQSVVLQLGQAKTDTSFEAIVPPGLPLGSYDLVVTNPSGRAGVRASAFTIGPVTPTPSVPGPRIDSVEPDEGFNDSEVTIKVEGRNFMPDDPGFRVQLRIGQEIEAELSLVEGTGRSDSFNAIIPRGLAPGIYDLWVINPDNRQAIEPSAYESKAP